MVEAENPPSDLRANVYRFFELFDLPNIAGSLDLLREVADGKRRMSPPPKPWIEEKLWFALFWLRPLADFWRRELGAKHFLALQKVIPRTWLMDPQPLPPTGVYPGLDIQSWEELKKFSQRERELVLKISGFSELAWGSRSVKVGQDLSHEDWVWAIDVALGDWGQSPWILQKFHHARVVEMDYAAGDRINPLKSRVRLCPYYFCGERETKLGGVLATVCPADKKLLHGMRDAILAPVAGLALIPTSPSFKTSRVRVSAVSGSTRALARGAVRLARRFGSNRFIGEAPMKTAEAAVLVRCEAARSSGVEDPGHRLPLGW